MINSYNQKLYNQLEDSIWATKGTRFLTYRKYKSIYNILNFLNTLFSFLLIVIAIYKIGGFKIWEGKYDKHMDVILLIFSIYIFSVSFYLTTLELKVNTIFKNATNLSYLLRKLKLVKNNKDLNNISKKYKKLEDELNHDTMDYKIWCDTVKSDKHKNSWLGKIYYNLVWHISGKFPILILFIVCLYFIYSS